MGSRDYFYNKLIELENKYITTKKGKLYLIEDNYDIINIINIVYNNNYTIKIDHKIIKLSGLIDLNQYILQMINTNYNNVKYFNSKYYFYNDNKDYKTLEFNFEYLLISNKFELNKCYMIETIKTIANKYIIDLLEEYNIILNNKYFKPILLEYYEINKKNISNKKKFIEKNVEIYNTYVQKYNFDSQDIKILYLFYNIETNNDFRVYFYKYK